MVGQKRVGLKEGGSRINKLKQDVHILLPPYVAVDDCENRLHYVDLQSRLYCLCTEVIDSHCRRHYSLAN